MCCRLVRAKSCTRSSHVCGTSKHSTSSDGQQSCGSGLKSIAVAAQAIQTGDAEIVIAGGMDSMSNAPDLLPQARTGYRLGDETVVDSMIRDGLWDVYND